MLKTKVKLSIPKLDTLKVPNYTRPGKYTKSYGKSPCLMDKSTINGNLPINGVLMGYMMVIQWHLMGFNGIYDGDSMAFNGI